VSGTPAKGTERRARNLSGVVLVYKLSFRFSSSFNSFLSNFDFFPVDLIFILTVFSAMPDEGSLHIFTDVDAIDDDDDIEQDYANLLKVFTLVLFLPM